MRSFAKIAVAVAVIGAGAFGCEDQRTAPAPLDQAARPNVERPASDPCARPDEGCPCEEEGEQTECGSIKEQRGDYLICSRGVRACADGVWGECIPEYLTNVPKSLQARLPQSRLLALGGAQSCNNLCDPECTKLADTPTGIAVPSELQATPDGLTLISGSSGGSCSDLAVTPSSATVTITNIATSGAVTATPSSVQFSGTCSGGLAVQPNWSLDAYDRAVIDASGELHVFSGIAGQLEVTAKTATDTDTSTVNVKVQIGTLVATGTTADPGKTLYPYKNTLFPLDLPAPLVQWDGGGVTPTQVQVALRYPAGSATPKFLYTNTYSSEPRQGTLNTSGPAWQVPQQVWSAFDRSAAGDPVGGEILIRRKTASTTYAELKIPVKFTSAAVRGTAYYTQYLRTLSTGTCSSQSCNYSGSSYVPGQICPVGIVTHGSGTLTSQIRAIDLSSPKASNTDPFNNAGGCPVCHSVSADGSVFVSGNQGWQKPISGGISEVSIVNGKPTFTPQGKAPTYSGLSDEGSSATDGDPYNQYERNGENSRGFSYGAISPDGSLVMQGPTFWGNTEDTPSANNTQAPTLKGLAGHLKSYFFVDTDRAGVGVQFATTGALPSYSWSTGQFTGSSGALTVDGITLNKVGQSVLVRHESNKLRNGVYALTQVNPWRLARRYDMSSSDELSRNMRVRVSDGVAMAGRTFALTGPASGTITINSSSLDFTEVELTPSILGTQSRTVDVATTAALGPGTVTFAAGLLEAGTAGALVVDGVTLGLGQSVLVKNQAAQASNGVYTVTVPGTAVTKWRLTRRLDTSTSLTLTPGLEVKVSGGLTNYDRVFYVSSPSSGTINVNSTAISFSEGGVPAMMTPQFSPDGTQVVYVNADADTAGGLAPTGWRRGLSIVDFDPATRSVSQRRRLLNTWNASTLGVPFKWPFFESDSRSIIYVESEPSEFCAQADSDNGISVNSDIRRACFEASYGSMSPTTRGYWKGRLYSLDSDNPAATRAELSKLNDADDDGGADDATDGDRAYQPTVLPFSSGGYRWVIFASPRAYGNQFNQKSSSGTPTHFSCSANMLWMSAITDKVADGTDRSHPAFLLPGQNIQKITTANHFVNERGYLVPSLCKNDGASCSSDDECCGALSSPPTQACRAPSGWTSADGPPAKTCESLDGTCNNAGESCSTSADCCNGAACVDFACAAPSAYSAGTFTRDYSAECGTGQHPNWQLFSFHLTTDGDSKLTFTARSARNQADLNSATVVALGTSTETRVSPTAPAYLDVGGALEAAKVSRHYEHLRISITLEPSSDGKHAPILHDWEMRYTCEFGE